MLQRAFDGLPPSKVIISGTKLKIDPWLEELAKVIEGIRGSKPLVIAQSRYIYYEWGWNNGLEKKCIEWLCNGKNDIIIDKSYLSGFEWPSVIWTGPYQPSQDLTMRAVSTLVIVRLKVDDFNKLICSYWSSIESNME